MWIWRGSESLSAWGCSRGVCYAYAWHLKSPSQSGNTFHLLIWDGALDRREERPNLHFCSQLFPLSQDITVLHGLGVRIVLIIGSSWQIEDQLRKKGLASVHKQGVRVTDTAAMTAALEASGRNYVEVSSRLSRGAPIVKVLPSSLSTSRVSLHTLIVTP